jgi:hypothetical protein
MDIDRIIYNAVKDVKDELKSRVEAMLRSAKQFPPSDFGNGQISTLTAFLFMLDDVIQLGEKEPIP